MSNSLRIRLLWWLLVPLALYVLVTGETEYDNARRTANLVQDNQLVASARMIAGEVEWMDGFLRVDVPPAALEIFASPYRDQVFYSVRVDDGRLLAGTPDFPPRPVQAPDVPDHYYTELRGHQVRAVDVERLMYDNGMTHRVRVTVGKTVRSRDAMTQQLWQPQLVRQIVMIALAVALVCIGLTFELRPLIKVKDEVADRDPMQLAPIRVERLHSELRPIVEAINQCIARLGVQVAAQRRFIADAAHQLRTPLTVLGTQLQFARQQDGLTPALDEALAAMHRSNRSMVGLTNKLLLLAQAEAADNAQLATESVDLVPLAMEVVEDLAVLAQAREIDLGAELDGAATVVGHRGLLLALIANLADNAIRYTGSGGHVTVAVKADGGTVTVSVIDNGPGIPAESRGRVFEPFFRASTDTDGTGLGLAIVREIADAHRGEVTLKPGEGGRGLHIAVIFPRAAPAADA
jgi:two-component system sensor histidine kinase TctE